MHCYLNIPIGKFRDAAEAVCCSMAYTQSCLYTPTALHSRMHLNKAVLLISYLYIEYNQIFQVYFILSAYCACVAFVFVKYSCSSSSRSAAASSHSHRPPAHKHRHISIFFISVAAAAAAAAADLEALLRGSGVLTPSSCTVCVYYAIIYTFFV